MAAVDADVKMYEAGVIFIQGIFIVHDPQLRVIQFETSRIRGTWTEGPAAITPSFLCV
jgi:hypothetical protein